MSYCVNCGVELDNTASKCVLCDTPVYNPKQKLVESEQTPFPQIPQTVPDVLYGGLSLLLTIILASVALCCWVLNLFMVPHVAWSVYAIGGATLLWVWCIPPLLLRNRVPRIVRIFWDLVAVGLYVYSIARGYGDTVWYWKLALPIILTGGVVILFWCCFFSYKKRSILTSVVIILGGLATFLFAIEGYIDRFLGNPWVPTWSILVMTICAGVIIPLVIIRRVPLLREEVRRRFHI